jgi:hypothetical protein
MLMCESQAMPCWPDENGPVVVTLFKYDSPMNDISENGTITSDNLKGPIAGKQISDLAAARGNGTHYVNVHTQHRIPTEKYADKVEILEWSKIGGIRLTLFLIFLVLGYLSTRQIVIPSIIYLISLRLVS